MFFIKRCRDYLVGRLKNPRIFILELGKAEMRQLADASLVVERGLSELTSISLNITVSTFGSSESTDATLDNPFVSRRHFQIRNQEGVYFVSDLDSTNGTILNGENLLPNSERRVKDGDLIGLAMGEVLLRFVDPASTIRIAPNPAEITVDQDSRSVWVRGQLQEPPLPRKEFDVLNVLFSNKGNAVSREEIATHGWPERPDGDVTDEEIDQYIRRLRRRVEVDASDPKLIVTLRGFGYRMA